MGLDQYMWKQMKNDECEHEPVEVGYWRKVRHIQNWMESMWVAQGNEGDFNLAPLTMTHSLLDELEKAIETGDIQEHDSDGFFFGSYDFSESNREYTLNVINECRDAIDAGWHVYYDSWW